MPDFTWTDGLLYRFSASTAVFADPEGTVAAGDMDPVARWGNLGAREDATQPVPANRPRLRTGGLNGRPYLSCDSAFAQCFGNLAFAQPAGTTTIAPFTVFAVTDTIDVTDQFPALLGAPLALGGKVSLYFRAPAGEQIHWIKSQIRIGTLANPQLLMAAVGRNAAGVSTNPHTRFWMRQNRQTVFAETSQSSGLTSTAIASTEFLRSTGLGEGYFSGHLYEFLLYDGTLDTPTTFAIEDWLMARYGLG
ncbi:MAG: hypothetical protein ACXIUW_08430 [Roseinatronobacter sp.]